MDGLKDPKAPPPGNPNNHHSGDAANQKNMDLSLTFSAYSSAAFGCSASEVSLSGTTSHGVFFPGVARQVADPGLFKQFTRMPAARERCDVRTTLLEQDPP